MLGNNFYPRDAVYGPGFPFSFHRPLRRTLPLWNNIEQLNRKDGEAQRINKKTLGLCISAVCLSSSVEQH